MSEETADVFNAMRRDRQERHQDWHRKNMAELEKAGFYGKVTNNGECVCFAGQVKADFYPSTGRWRAAGKTYSGGAKKFILWHNSLQKSLPVPFGGNKTHVTFDDWWREVGLHAAARGIDIDHDQESYRECYEDGLEPWEAVEG